MESNTARIHQAGQTTRLGLTQSVAHDTGRLDGTSLRVRANDDDVDERIQAEQMARSAGLLSNREPKTLAQFKLSTNNAASDLGLAQARKFENTFSAGKKIAASAQEMLRSLMEGRPLPRNGSSPSEVADRFASLARLREALTGDDDTFVALMSALPNGAPDLKALARQLQEAGDDEQAMQGLLSDIRGDASEDEFSKAMTTARFDPQALKRLLRETQSLPTLDKLAREELAEKVQDEIAELLRRDESHVRAMDAVIEKAGGERVQAAALSYDELVHSGWKSFPSMLEILVSRHPPKELSQQIMPLMEQTLAHELGRGAEQRSVDKSKLEALMNWLQCFRIARGLFLSLEKLTTTMGRTYGVN